MLFLTGGRLFLSEPRQVADEVGGRCGGGRQMGWRADCALGDDGLALGADAGGAPINGSWAPRRTGGKPIEHSLYSTIPLLSQSIEALSFVR